MANRQNRPTDPPTASRAQIPVHCVGIQAYLTPNAISWEILNLRLEALGKLNVTLYISEFQWPGKGHAIIWVYPTRAVAGGGQGFGGVPSPGWLLAVGLLVG